VGYRRLARVRPLVEIAAKPASCIKRRSGAARRAVVAYSYRYSLQRAGAGIRSLAEPFLVFEVALLAVAWQTQARLDGLQF
jgi:hypothetical protein